MFCEKCHWDTLDLVDIQIDNWGYTWNSSDTNTLLYVSGIKKYKCSSCGFEYEEDVYFAENEDED